MAKTKTDADADLDLDLGLDLDRLPEQWQDQAAMMLEWSLQLADAMLAADEAKAALSVVAADVELDVRGNPDAHGLEKVTEATVAAAVQLDEAMQEAVDTHNQARHRVNVLRGVVDALEHRKRALQGATDLFLRQLYADPKGAQQPDALRSAAGAKTAPKAATTTKTVTTRRRRRKPATEA